MMKFFLVGLRVCMGMMAMGVLLLPGQNRILCTLLL